MRIQRLQVDAMDVVDKTVRLNKYTYDPDEHTLLHAPRMLRFCPFSCVDLSVCLQDNSKCCLLSFTKIFCGGGGCDLRVVTADRF